MKKLKLSIRDFQETARKNGGSCLSKKYLGLHQKMEWVCSLGHVFVSRAEDVRRGSWCRKCSDIKINNKRKKYFFEKINKVVKAKDAFLLSTEYVDKNTKVKVKCCNSHIFTIRPHDLLRGHWCSKCAGNAKFTIQDCQKIAKKKKWQMFV